MFTKPPALKSPSIRQPPYSKDVQKQKNKTSPTTPKNLPKPNSLKITSNPKPLHQMLPKNSPNVNTSTSSINTDINKQSFASTPPMPLTSISLLQTNLILKPLNNLHGLPQIFSYIST
ncbi:hypothetical protein QTP88_018765 [Uroleucon formosanum]